MAEIKITKEQLLSKAMDALNNNKGYKQKALNQSEKNKLVMQYGMTEQMLKEELFEFYSFIRIELANIIPEFNDYQPSQLFITTITNVNKYEMDASQAKALGYTVDGNKKKITLIKSADINLKFKPRVVRRPSLNSNGKEVDNILVLLSQGWQCHYGSHMPTGYWRGNMIRGLSQRNSNIFMSQIIDEYNMSMRSKRLIATLDEKYNVSTGYSDTYEDIGVSYYTYKPPEDNT